MKKSAVFVFLSFCVLGVSAVAAADRYKIIPVDDGDTTAYLRADLQTGALSHCSQSNETWQCVPVADEQDTRTAALQGRIAELEARIVELEASQRQLPDEEELSKALDTSEKVLRRFFGIVQSMKQDLAAQN